MARCRNSRPEYWEMRAKQQGGCAVREHFVAGVDVGSQNITVVIGQIDRQGHMHIVGAAQAPSFGMKRGGIINLDEVVNALSVALERAAHLISHPLKTAYFSVTGAHVESGNHRGAVAITPSNRDIDFDDVQRVLDGAGAIPLDAERQIIAIMPRIYAIDGQEGIKNPIGMSGHRLEVEAHIVTGAISAYRNWMKVAARAHIEIEDFVLASLASAEAVLAPSEREMGTVLIDLGAGTADVAIYADGGVWRTFMSPLGGQLITDDVAYGLRLPTPIAEEIKKHYGSALPRRVDPDETIELSQFLPNCQEVVKRRALASIIAPRAEEMLTLIGTEIKRSGRERLLAGGVVLTGGTADLAGITDLASEVFDAPVRIGAPHSLYGATANVAAPSFATAVGLLRWHEQMLGGTASSQSSPFGGLESWFAGIRHIFESRG